MKIPFALVVLFYSGVALACGEQDAVSNRPFDREEAHARALLLKEQFDELDALDKRSRDPAAALSDGQPLRNAVFAGLAGDDIVCESRTKSVDERKKELQIYRAKVAAWRRSSPKAMTPLLLEAQFPKVDAWIVRGGEYASQVPPEAWPVFKRHLAEARKRLDALPNIVKEDPQWYETRLQVAQGESDDEAFASTLARGLDKYPLYLPLYFQAMDSLDERWGGSPAQQAAFLEEAVKRTSPQLGQTMYARLQWSNWSRDMFKTGAASWPRMKQGFEAIVKDYPDAWNLNNYAKFACLAQDPETLNKLLPRVQKKVTIEAWDEIGFYKWCLDLAELNKPSH